MRALDVLVEAVGATSGGGLRVLTDTLSALTSSPDIARVTLCSSPTLCLPDDLDLHPKLEVAPKPHATHDVGRAAWHAGGFGEFARSVRPDVALCMHGMGITQANLPRVMMLQQPLLFDPHALATMPTRARARLLLMRALTAAHCRGAARVLAHTPIIAARAAGQLHLDPARVALLAPHVPTPPPLPPQAPHPVVLYLGHDLPYKNLTTLYNAWVKVHGAMPDAQLWLTLKQGPALPGARYLGALTREQVWQALGESWLVVMPSLTETIGLPMMEAMSCARTLLVADLPHARSLCGAAGVYVEASSPKHWASMMLWLLRDAEIREAFGARGLRRAAQLRARHPSERLVWLLRQAASEAPPCG